MTGRTPLWALAAFLLSGVSREQNTAPSAGLV